MGRITIHDNPFEQGAMRTEELRGPLLSFLRKEYPDGFPGNHRLYVNGGIVAPEDYDDVQVGLCDDVQLYLMPGVPAAAIGAYVVTALITAAVSVAVSFIFSKLFSTKAQDISSASSETPAAESVYSLASPSNVAALGAPIPVIYGRVLTTPKLASQPYSWYSYNQQYVDILLCLGHGRFNVHEIQIAGSPIQQMPAGVVQYKIHDIASHGQNLGNIEIEWGNHFFEDVDTTPEVSDQELVPPYITSDIGTIQTDGTLLLTSALDANVSTGRTTSTTETRFNNGTRTLTEISVNRLTLTFSPALSRTLEETRTSGVEYLYTPPSGTPLIGSQVTEILMVSWASGGTLPFSLNYSGSGDVVDLDGEIFNATSVSVSINRVEFQGSVAPGSTLVADTLTSVPNVTFTFKEYYLTQLNKYPYSLDTMTSAVGPFMVSRPGGDLKLVELDFVFPNGLYTVNEENGALHNAWVEYTITLTQVDDNGTPTGAPVITVSETHQGATNTPIRFSYLINVTSGRWMAQVRRNSQKSSKAVDQSDMYWTGLKGILHTVGKPAYGDVTLISIRIKATDGIASDALNKIGVDCTRLLPNGKPSANPAAIYEDIVTNTVYGAARPADELDTTALAALSSWDTGFNGIFDFSGRVWDSIVTVLRPFQARPLPLGPKFSSTIDRPSSAVATFTNSNGDETGAIVLDSMEFSWQYAQEGEEDGFEIEYRDPKDWIARYVRYPSDSLNPMKENLMGCTDPVRALAYAKYLWNVREYRKEFLTFEVELEGHLVQIGDVVNVNHTMINASYVVAAIRVVDSHRVSLDTYRYDTRVWS